MTDAMTHRPPPLEGLSVSRLIPLLARRHRSLVYEPLRQLGLAPGQELLLMQLWENGPQRPAELAHALTVTGPTITKMVARLEHAGYVSRTRALHDGRVVLVALTPIGQALRADVEEIWQRLEERTVRSLAATDQHDLKRLLTHLVNDLSDAPASPLQG